MDALYFSPNTAEWAFLLDAANDQTLDDLEAFFC